MSTSWYTKDTSTTNIHVQKERYLTDSVSHDRKQQIEQELMVNISVFASNLFIKLFALAIESSL